MPRPQDLERPAAVLALALAAWGAAVLLAAANGVFARISPETAAALAILAAAFAPAALALDAGLRDHVKAIATRTLAIALGTTMLAALLLAGASLRRHGLSLEAAVTAPFALLTYFVGPVALGIGAALVQRAAARLTRSAPARSPAARPGAQQGGRTSARGAGAAGA
jgi:hypothetical protein